MTDLPEFLLARMDWRDEWAEVAPRGETVERAEAEAVRRIVYDARDVLDPPFGWLGRAFVRFWLKGQVEQTLRTLALPYADHPDYREEWRP